MWVFGSTPWNTVRTEYLSSVGKCVSTQKQSCFFIKQELLSSVSPSSMKTKIWKYTSRGGKDDIISPLDTLLLQKWFFPQPQKSDAAIHIFQHLVAPSTTSIYQTYDA